MVGIDNETKQKKHNSPSQMPHNKIWTMASIRNATKETMVGARIAA